MSIPLVTVQGKVLTPSGSAVSKGTVTVHLSQAARAVDGSEAEWIGGESTFTLGTAGALPTDFQLAPNDVLIPAGTVQVVTFSVIAPSGRPMSWVERWSLSSSPNPIDIGDVTRVGTSASIFVAGPRGATGATGATGAGTPGLSAPAPIFVDTTTGLAGTAEGSYFSVPSASAGESYILYRKVSGAASAIKRFPLALQNVYADSANGSDANDGLTKATPKATIAAAVALFNSDFGTLWLARGSRFKETAGTTLSRFTHVRAHGGGERPIVDGSRALTNANFAAVGGYANVYQVTVDFSALGFTTMPYQLYSQTFFQLFEGPPGRDTRLAYANGSFNNIWSWVPLNTDDATRLAYVRDNPGTFHIRKGDGSALPVDYTTDPGHAFTFYVHLPDSGNPITNGKEYSVSGVEPAHWSQLLGGTIEDVWFTRSGHRNGCQWTGGTMRRCLIDQYPIHGGFWNSMYTEDTESDGVYGAGACFHGYRNTATLGSDLGNTFVRCKAVNGAWGFYAHGNGGPNPQLFAKLTDCETHNCATPYDLATVQGLTVLRGKNYSSGIAISGDGGTGGVNHTYTDTTWFLGTDANNSGAFSYAAATLTDCFISGGASVNGRLTNTAGVLNLINTTVLAVASTLFAAGSTQVNLTNSIWPAAGAPLVVSAVNSFVPGLALDYTGACPTNGQVTGCQSPRRKSIYSRTMTAQGSGGWLATSCSSSNWLFVSGVTDIEVDRAGGYGLSFGPNSVIRVSNYDGAGNDFVSKVTSYAYAFYGTNRDRVQVVTAPAATYTKNSVTSYDQLRSTISVWPKTATSMYCRPDTNAGAAGSVVTLYGNAADTALVTAGTPLRLSFDKGDALVDAGLYWVQSVAADAGGPRVTLDRAVVYPVAFSVDDWANYKQQDDKAWGPGDWSWYQSMPRLEVRLPAGKQNRNVFSIALPSGATFTPNAKGYMPIKDVSGSDPYVYTGYIDNPNHGFVADLTIEPQNTTEANGGTATLTMEQYFFDLDPTWQSGDNGLLRISPSSYLYGKGIGCTL